METIIYQGQPTKATLVNYLSGAIPTSTVEHDGDEDLFRDEAGRYYLRRQLSRLDSEGECRPASGRTHVHRISIKAAILWATTRLNSQTLDLRLSAADALKVPALTGDTRHGVSESTLKAAACYAAKHGRTLDQFIVDCLEMVAKDDQFVPVSGGEAETPGTVSPASAGPVAPLVEEPQPGVRRFTFDYSASRWLAARRRTVELTDEQMERARELAEAFNMDLLPFLQGLVDRNHLPGQSCRKDAKVYNLLQGEHIGFVCTDVAMARRIERAAQSRGESVEEYVAHALGGDVDAWEECMLLHPTTGDLLDTDYEELYTEVKCEYMLAPLGRENEPAAALSVRLDDEAAALVRRYLEVTAWNFTAADIVSGCVVHALGIAFENQKEAEEMSGLANPQEHDGAWGYVETRINDAACRRTGSEGTELKNPDDARTTGTGRTVIDLDAPDRAAYHREHAGPNPASVALLAASAPEQEPLPVEIHQDKPVEGTSALAGKEGK